MADASGVGDYRQECESYGLRRSKKQRIPKRGPGVAELEKILREQEQKDDRMEKGNGIGFEGICSSSSLPVSAVHGHGNGSSWLGCVTVGADGRSKGVYIGRSGVFLPEQTLMPTSWGSSSEMKWKHEEAPKMATGFSFPVLVSNGSAPPPMLQNNRLSMMNLFPLSATTTPSSSPGVFHHVESPSSQKPSHHNHISTVFHEEDKIMSTKRPRPSVAVENWQSASPPILFQPILPQVSRLDPLSSSSNNGFNFGISRDQNPLPTSPWELKMKPCVSDNGNPSGNSGCLLDLSKFNKKFPFQENIERSLLQKSSSSSSESEVSGYNKGFFSFLLQPEELQRPVAASAEDILCLETEKCCTDKTGDFIDLNLKL